jgi:hypothetical protein
MIFCAGSVVFGQDQSVGMWKAVILSRSSQALLSDSQAVGDCLKRKTERAPVVHHGVSSPPTNGLEKGELK